MEQTLSKMQQLQMDSSEEQSPLPNIAPAAQEEQVATEREVVFQNTDLPPENEEQQKAVTPVRRGVKLHRGKSNQTCQTINLPESKHNREGQPEIEISITKELKHEPSQGKVLLPTPILGAALEQIDVERRQRNNLSQV